ncbi:chemokine XC receptor 1-like [Archocentrus centrarchus]|uniref:chemokine XC receptor 1-like n=1 Tax=Archocentrus centrarchus TaxID=63155 RepID=UPI0011E9DDC5|nr:chemokine XC receptor 1-like [Archocentrus centrarchus]
MALSSDEFTLFNLTESSELKLQVEQSAQQRYAAAIIILIFCISLPGNSFLLWVLRREQAWKSTPDILLLQLTVANLCFTLNLPFEACNVLHGWIFGDWACGVGIWVYYLGLNTSVVILTAMSLHYYVSAVQVSCLCAQVSRKCGVLVASILIWLVGAVSSIKLSVNSGVTHDEVCVHMESLTMLLVDLYMEIFLFFLIPFFIVTFCYVHMWIMVKQGRINSNQQPSKLILWITVAIFLCLTPYCVLNFIMTLEILGVLNLTRAGFHVLHFAWAILYPLSHFYCCLSPLFHIIGAQRFRKYVSILCNPLSQSRDVSNNESSVVFIHLKDEEM